jgi:hypothetical protein
MASAGVFLAFLECYVVDMEEVNINRSYMRITIYARDKAAFNRCLSPSAFRIFVAFLGWEPGF